MLKLIKPSEKYKKSFLKSLKKRADMEEISVEKYDLVKSDFKKYVLEMKFRAQGKSLNKGYVPESVYWLVDGEEFFGRVSVRHKLSKHLKNIGGHIGYDINPYFRKRGYGKEILRLGLKKAKLLGLKKVLITCNETNIGSRKIIESNGGVFENRYMDDNLKTPKLRYWIKL